jgi:hypothetical protein
LRLIANLAALLITACTAIFPTPTATPLPPTPTPSPALPPNAVWIAFEGQAGNVLTVDIATGAATAIALPLNQGQTATGIRASRDGGTLVFQVWSGGTTQHGIAVWPLTLPNARLVLPPLAGYRIIDAMLSDDGQTVYAVQVQNGKLPAEAHWRLESIPADGGTSSLLASRDSAPTLDAPRLLETLPDGRLLIDAATTAAPDSAQVLQGLFVVGVSGEPLASIGAPGDRIVTSGTISPDGAWLAYTAYSGPLPGEEGSQTTVLEARLIELASGQTLTMNAGTGLDITSLLWTPDGRLLFDIVPLAEGRAGQMFALAEIDQPLPWLTTSPDPTREALFTYAPLQGGVIYTTQPPTGATGHFLYILPTIGSQGAAVAYPLGAIDPAAGAPMILRAP